MRSLFQGSTTTTTTIMRRNNVAAKILHPVAQHHRHPPSIRSSSSSSVMIPFLPSAAPQHSIRRSSYVPLPLSHGGGAWSDTVDGFRTSGSSSSSSSGGGSSSAPWTAWMATTLLMSTVSVMTTTTTKSTTTLLEPAPPQPLSLQIPADDDRIQVEDDDDDPTDRHQNQHDIIDETEATTTTILNWSGTHAVQVRNDRYWEPDTIAEVATLVDECHRRGQSIRPVGSALSPNGIAFCPDGMISLGQLDHIVHVDTEQSTVTVQAGARVSQVVEALRPYHLTLPNLASIAEQQMGGFVQVGAHGTGKAIAPVDHYVTQLTLVTPTRGILTLTEQDGELFHMAKVGLGCLGVVVQVTMQCIPAHYLQERTFVLTRQEAKEQVETLLQNHKHMRYMWIPYTDTVVCVTNDPVDMDHLPDASSSSTLTTTTKASESKSSHSWFRRNDKSDGVDTNKRPFQNKLSASERRQPLVDLLLQVSAEVAATNGDVDPIYTKESVRDMGFGALRDAILALKDPLDLEHVRLCHQAEAEFWKRNEDTIIKPSDELLQFDCGGQQWVWEVCFPTGTQECNNGNDMRFMEQLLEGIESRSIPAHAPIEQRWSASSSSYMSPAYGPPDGLHSWVGIINYLPSTDGTLTSPEQEMLQRQKITALFTGSYCDLMRQVGQTVNATSHWAKLEAPKSLWDLIDLQLFLNTRFPLDRFNAWRGQLDPKNILGSPLLNMLLGKPKPNE